ACAVGMERSVGSLAVGKLCDLVVWDVDDYRAIPYHYGVNLAATVVKRGTVVSTRGHNV
ncbi:amidohydrolase family protein, partial [bacterium]|nr:amidohydrolase family protein [bacterium]